MTFVLKTMDGNRYRITEQEYKAVIIGDGLLVFSSCGVTINKSRIEAVYPESKADEIENKKTQTTGFLHDGTRVRKHFGQWVDASQSVPSEKENGDYVPVRIDPNYYPEVAQDCVLDEREFEKIKTLPPVKRLEIILQDKRTRQTNKVFAPIGSLLANKI